MSPIEESGVDIPGMELPVLDLFLQLQDAALPLGIGEYRLLIRALQMGFGTENAKSLRQLCKTLWTKTPREERLLDYHFDLMLDQQAVERQPALDEHIPWQEATEQPPAVPPSGGEIEGLVAEPQPPSAVSTGKYRPVDDVQIQRAAEVALETPGPPARCFILSGVYYPVTRRQMKQNWRYLRRMVREGPPTELNVEETVKKIGREGVLLEPVLEPRRINCMELLLLIDQKGSMVPFHYLSRGLVETAEMGGRLGRAGIYYFQNVPRDHLYLTPALVEARTIASILSGLHQGRTVVMIFSDAGAARGRWNHHRFEHTQTFLKQVESAVRRIAWLNPMPQDRWRGTTAEEIAHLVPMFEFNRHGMDVAIDVLRGRYMPVIGRM